MAGADPDKIKALLDEGLSLYGDDRVDEAVARWREALNLDPECNDARDFLADAGFPTDAPTAGSPAIELQELAEAPTKPERPAEAPRERLSQKPPIRKKAATQAPKKKARKKTAAKASPPANERAMQSLLADAVSAVARHQSEQALEILEALGQRDPTNLDVQCYYELVRAELADVFRDRLGAGSTVYEIVSRAELFDLNLPTEAGYLASLIDGEANLDGVLGLSAIDRFETVRTLIKLLKAGAIRVAR